MRQGTSISASLAAIASSLASMACCLPIGFVGALGLAGVSAFLLRYRAWFLGLSVVLLGVGFWQQHRAKQCSSRPTTVSSVLLWMGVVVVVGMILFPQQIAGFIADRFSGAWK